MKPNRTMLPPDEGYLQPALVRLGRAISVAGFAGSRNPLASTPAQCSATKIYQRMVFTDIDRLVFARLYHLAPGVLNALKIVKPETVIRWHRAGFRAYWRRRSGPRGGFFSMEVQLLPTLISTPGVFCTRSQVTRQQAL